MMEVERRLGSRWEEGKERRLGGREEGWREEGERRRERGGVIDVYWKN